MGGGWNTTSFRWLAIYAVLFALSMMVLIGFIGWSVTTRMESDSDGLIRWELFYFDSVSPADLPKVIEQRTRADHARVSFFGLFDKNGTFIAGDILHIPPNLKESPDTEAFEAPGQTLRSGIVVQERARMPVFRVIAQRRPDGTCLLVARDLTAVLRIREVTINALIGGGFFFLLVGVGTGFVLSWRQMRRVRAIRRATLRIATGDLNQRLPIGGRDELDMLAHLVNHMLEEIERLMGEVKGACDGIAHDLRTPLSHVHTLLGHIAERTEGLADSQINVLVEQARSETDLLLDRFRAMLRISEIGSLKRRGGFALVDLTTLVKDLCELYQPLAEDRSLQWVVNVAQVDGIQGDRSLLFEAFSNILDNAIKFSPEGGAVEISLSASLLGPSLTITDAGPGIPERERGAVLQRFYRGADTSQIAGSGLGLSIVSAVMHLHDFTLLIETPSSGIGSTLQIQCWPHALD